MKEEATGELAKEIAEFAARAGSLVLATVDETQVPLASYAPFVRDETGSLFVYVSKLSAHTGNLARGQVSAMIIEDESASKQIYARKRMVFQCEAREIGQQDPTYQDVIRHLRRRHGEVIELLTTLPDFLLFRLVPLSGTFVRGFGQAYRIDATFTDIEHIDADSLKRR